jgi:hypothetical protein
MFKLDKKTLTELAGLGAGSAAAAYVQQNILTKKNEDGSIMVDEAGNIVTLFGSGQTANLIVDIAPAAVGLFLQGQGSFLKEAGKGMIAASIGGLIKKSVPALGITGTDTLLGTVEAPTTDDRPLMGYSSDSMDLTAGNAGEMDF